MILAQVGWRKGDLIETGAKDGTLGGAVLSPYDAGPVELASQAVGLKKEFKPQGLVFIDPQLYVSTISGADDGKLAAYPYYSPGLSRADFGPAKVAHRVKELFDLQSSLKVDRWVSPTITLNGFRDSWSQVALTLAEASVTDWDSREKGRRKPLLLSFVLDEGALRDRPALDEYLDALTAFEADGFYLLVKRNDIRYPAAYEEDMLANLLYLVYSLGHINSFEVVNGYTDLVGTLLLAVGAKANCSGWFTNLRQFSFNRFIRTGHGRAARPRYTSRQLMNSILINPELDQIHLRGKLSLALSKTRYDSVMNAGPTQALWPQRTSALHHWTVLSELDAAVSKGKKISDRLSILEALVSTALATYTTLGAAGVPFVEPPTGPRDSAMWTRVIKRFRSEVGV